MAIQFQCGGCRQPIEVDDPLANQVVRCPYCGAAVTVPASSTFVPDQVATARPAGNLPPAPQPGTPIGSNYPPPPPLNLPPVPGAASPAARAGGARYANAGLVCAILVLLCFAVVFVRLMISVMAALPPELTSSPEKMSSPEAQAKLQELSVEVFKSDAILLGFWAGLSFFAFVGLTFAAISFRFLGVENWRGWVTMVICVPVTLCMCCGLFSSMGGVS